MWAESDLDTCGLRTEVGDQRTSNAGASGPAHTATVDLRARGQRVKIIPTGVQA